jgi:hypothetical protein
MVVASAMRPLCLDIDLANRDMTGHRIWSYHRRQTSTRYHQNLCMPSWWGVCLGFQENAFLQPGVFPDLRYSINIDHVDIALPGPMLNCRQWASCKWKGMPKTLPATVTLFKYGNVPKFGIPKSTILGLTLVGISCNPQSCGLPCQESQWTCEITITSPPILQGQGCG